MSNTVTHSGQSGQTVERTNRLDTLTHCQIARLIQAAATAENLPVRSINTTVEGCPAESFVTVFGPGGYTRDEANRLMSSLEGSGVDFDTISGGVHMHGSRLKGTFAGGIEITIYCNREEAAA